MPYNFANFKGELKKIEESIVGANLSLSVVVDGEGVRIIVPQLTTESREKLVRTLKEKLEANRIAVRRERERVWDEIQGLERSGKITEDEKFRAKDDLQKIIEEANKNLENIFERKEKEIRN